MSDLEWRSAIELRATGAGHLIGYASVYNSPSQDLGGFIEIVRAGAFDRSLADPAAITAIADHDRRSLLGRVGAGTLTLASDTRGLHFDVSLPDTTVGRDLAVLVQRGDIGGASFGFMTPKGGDRWDFSSQPARRELLDVRLHHIAITASPAYSETSVAKRALAERERSPLAINLARRYLMTLGG